MKKVFILFIIPFFGLAQFNPVFFYKQSSRSFNLANGIIAIYNFQNNGVDSRNMLNGAVGSDITFGAGVNGNCGIYNAATNAKISVPDNDIFTFTNGVSDLPFTFKMNFKQTTAGSHFIFEKANNAATLGEEYRVDIISSKVRILLVDKSGSGALIGKQTSASISLNTFYNLIITYDGSKTEAGIKIYLDGVLQTTTSQSAGTYTGMGNGTYPLTIGGTFGNGSASRFIGLIDELYIYNKVIDATEITFLQSNYY